MFFPVPRFFWAIALAITVLACGIGCAPVKAYQRGDLARKSMQSPFSKNELGADYDDKYVQTGTAAQLPGGTPGGGCGCTR